MAEAEYDKLNIAREYLDMAMQLYIEERSYFCAIHLAGAAEELFGTHLPEEERIFTMTWKAQRELHGILYGQEQTKKDSVRVVNQPKNAIKHDDFDERTVTVDPIRAARSSIEDALINFDKLAQVSQYKSRLPKSPIMWRFDDYRKSEDEAFVIGLRRGEDKA